MTLKLEDMELIRQQMAKYARFLDTKEFDKWQGIFTPGAQITFYNVDNSVMAEAPIEGMAPQTRQFFATTQTIHQTHGSEIGFSSDTEATAIFGMEDRHIYAPEGDAASKTMQGYGFYHTQWSKVGGEWKLARLELRRNIVIHA